MEMESLQKYHDLFIISIILILNTIINNINDQSSVKKNAVTFYQALENKQFDMTKTSDMIKKVFTVISKNIKLFKAKDSKLFTIKELKDNREVKITILPGIDLEEAYKKFNDDSKVILWKYLKVLYYASIKMIYAVNGTVDSEILKICESIQKNISENEIYNEFYENNPESKLYKKESSFNPYVGVGENNGNFGVDELTSGPQLLSDQTAPGIGSVASLLGIDKMFNLDQLTDQLKNIDPKEIDEASENIKKLLGGNVDEGTSEMINMMLHDITDELRKDKLSQGGNPVNSIFKVAEIVAGKMVHKIDPKKIDMNKVWQSTQNLAKNYTDQKGEKIFNGDNNPLTMLTGLMEKQMSHVKNNFNGSGQVNKQNQNEMLKEYQEIMSKMGMKNVNLGGLQNMMNTDSSANINLSDSSISSVSPLSTDKSKKVIKKKIIKNNKK